MAATLTLALAVGLTAALLGFAQARRERDRAERERDRAERLARQEATQRQRAEADEKKAQSEAARSTQVARFLKDMLGGVGPSVARGRDTTMLREILDRTADRIGRDLTNQPEVELEVRTILCNAYSNMGARSKGRDGAGDSAVNSITSGGGECSRSGLAQTGKCSWRASGKLGEAEQYARGRRWRLTGKSRAGNRVSPKRSRCCPTF